MPTRSKIENEDEDDDEDDWRGAYTALNTNRCLQRLEASETRRAVISFPTRSQPSLRHTIADLLSVLERPRIGDPGFAVAPHWSCPYRLRGSKPL